MKPNAFSDRPSFFTFWLLVRRILPLLISLAAAHWSVPPDDEWIHFELRRALEHVGVAFAVLEPAGAADQDDGVRVGPVLLVLQVVGDADHLHPGRHGGLQPGRRSGRSTFTTIFAGAAQPGTMSRAVRALSFKGKRLIAVDQIDRPTTSPDGVITSSEGEDGDEACCAQAAPAPASGNKVAQTTNACRRS